MHPGSIRCAHLKNVHVPAISLESAVFGEVGDRLLLCLVREAAVIVHWADQGGHPAACLPHLCGGFSDEICATVVVAALLRRLSRIQCRGSGSHRPSLRGAAALVACVGIKGVAGFPPCSLCGVRPFHGRDSVVCWLKDPHDRIPDPPAVSCVPGGAVKRFCCSFQLCEALGHPAGYVACLPTRCMCPSCGVCCHQ